MAGKTVAELLVEVLAQAGVQRVWRFRRFAQRNHRRHSDTKADPVDSCAARGGRRLPPRALRRISPADWRCAPAAVVDYGFVGDTRETLRALLPKLKQNNDDSHLKISLEHYRKARKDLDELANPGAAGKPCDFFSQLGGEPRLMLRNASGLTWIDNEHLLFSEIRGTGLHMAVLTAAESRADECDVYVPPRERGMAQRSYLSPDGKWV